MANTRYPQNQPQPYQQPKPAGRPNPMPPLPQPQPLPPITSPNPFAPATPQPVDPGSGTPGRSPAVLPPSPSTSRPIDIEPK